MSLPKNMLRLFSYRQSYCLWTLHLSRNSRSNISTEFYSKIPVADMSVRSISTGNCWKKDVILEADKEMLEVYRGSISNQIFKVKVFSVLTSIMGITAQPLLVQKTLEAESGMAVLIGVCTFFGFFTLVTPLLLHIVTRKYVVLLQYSPKTDTYTATTYSLFLQKKMDNFKADDIVIPDIPPLLTSFTVKGKPYFVDKGSFLDIRHYKKIMGFDKPVEFMHTEKDSIKK